MGAAEPAVEAAVGFIIDRRDGQATHRSGRALAADLALLRERQGLVSLALPVEACVGSGFLVAFRDAKGTSEELGFLIHPVGDIPGPGAPPTAPVVAKLCALLARLSSLPDFTPGLFAEVALALRLAYGGSRRATDVVRATGGLYPWQSDRALAYIDAHLASSFTTADLARECNMSVNHFARAFRVTHGMPPRQWVIRRRIACAKNLLVDARNSLTDVALSCGFAEQSHFTRVFTRIEGMPPGAWRRSGRFFRARRCPE
jgi:AraC family transcriptional regulator